MGFLSRLFGGGDDGAKAARREEEARQKRISDAISGIDQQFAGFDDAFFGKRAKAYQDFALPQLGEQYQDQARNLSFRMAGQGLLDSSAAQFLTNKLNRATSQQRQGLVDESLRQANQLRSQVAGEKANLYGQAQVAADPANAARLATASAANLQLPSTFAPVSNFLSGWANTYLADKVGQAYQNNPYMGGGSKTSFAAAPTTLRY